MTTDFTSGWEYQTDGAPDCTLPPDVQKAFDSATRGMLSLPLVPVLYAARRVGIGTSYCIVCKLAAQAMPGVPGYQVCYIHVDPDGRATLTKINPLIY